MDSHVSAGVTMVGMLFDGVGGLYLAYDLLGAEYNALSTLTRVVNYSMMLGIAYGIPLGLKFGIICGLGAGTALALQLSRISRGESDKEWSFVVCISLLRAMGIGGGLACLGNKYLAIAGAVLAFIFSMVVTLKGLMPMKVYEADTKPHITLRRILFSLAMGTCATIFAVGGVILAGHPSLIPKAATIGATLGFATAVVTSVSPIIEWYSDNMPPKSLGIVGAVMIVIGFGVQILPNLASLLDLPY